MKWTLAAAIAVVLAFGTAARAAEEKVLYCVDTAGNGFKWENGEAKPGLFRERRVVVKVHANGDRTIGELRHKCAPVWSHMPELLSCGSGVGSWLFNGNNYTYAYLYGETIHVRGDNVIWVAYGTCTDF